MMEIWGLFFLSEENKSKIGSQLSHERIIWRDNMKLGRNIPNKKLLTS